MLITAKEIIIEHCRDFFTHQTIEYDSKHGVVNINNHKSKYWM